MLICVLTRVDRNICIRPNQARKPEDQNCRETLNVTAVKDDYLASALRALGLQQRDEYGHKI
ncbi:hypothetical protein, partial [Arthrobacter sp. Bz4]|uniref:hypothetical protein n=1 Tax=Arthrobacter sp. Bz4 TaxID=2171979 RepID=UPI001A9C5D40